MGKSEDTSSLLSRTIQGLLEGATGLCATENKELLLRAGQLFQRIRSGDFVQVLKNEWDFFRERGKITDDYASTEQHRDCLQEILQSLDEDCPDEMRFQLLMKLFLATSAESVYHRTSVIPHQFIRVARSMSSGEILVLITAYKCYKQSIAGEKYSAASAWLQKIAADSGLEYPELVETFEQELIKKNLLTRRLLRDGSSVVKKDFRLTAFAISFCQLAESYDDLKK